MEIKIRPVQPAEYVTTKLVVQQAFAGIEYTDGDEHELIGRLRQEHAYHPEFDVVAQRANGEIIGHALLSEITICDQELTVTALVLAPLAVLPEYQHQGVGGRLIAYLEQAARQAGYPAISILGDPAYYSRFGYQPASNYGIKASFTVPTAYYLLKPLVSGGLSTVKGTIYYQAAFGLN